MPHVMNELFYHKSCQFNSTNLSFFYLSQVTLKWLLILLFSELQWVLSD
jgi:hypothetical protein